MATPENLHSCLNKNPIALHISAHGFIQIKDEIKKLKEVPLCLVFENSNDMSSNFRLNLEKLKGILDNHMKIAAKKLEFVMISACHSEDFGNVFIDAGVNHVICVDKS